MKKILIITILFLSMTIHSNAQENQDEHLLDGTTMNYYYQNGSAVHAEFNDGHFKYKWLAGPMKDMEGQDKYRSRKIGDKMYVVNFLNEPTSSFVTLIFNFNQNVMYSSGLIMPGTDQQQIHFDGGIIEHLHLKEN